MKYVLTVCLLLFSAIMFSACCTKPWQKYPALKKPDVAYRTGHSHGYDLYIWNCYKNERIVVFTYSAEMSCKEPQMQKTICGQKTLIEKRLQKQQKLPIPKSQKWPEK